MTLLELRRGFCAVPVGPGAAELRSRGGEEPLLRRSKAGAGGKSGLWRRWCGWGVGGGALARLRRDGRGSRRARGGKGSPVISPAISGAVAWSREGKERGGPDGRGRAVSGGSGMEPGRVRGGTGPAGLG